MLLNGWALLDGVSVGALERRPRFNKARKPTPSFEGVNQTPRHNFQNLARFELLSF
jgi:hypothetical protein